MQEQAKLLDEQFCMYILISTAASIVTFSYNFLITFVFFLHTFRVTVLEDCQRSYCGPKTSCFKIEKMQESKMRCFRPAERND